ncbi:MAG TPA: DUF4252 domain-containing protein [Blastocatellia bacterium]|nr:DUF4252 domain-containing protein [Blastocatellia bacterium]
MKLLITKTMRAFAIWALLSVFAAATAYGQDPAKINMSHLDKFADRADKVIDVTVDEALLRLAASFLNEKRSPDEGKIKELILGLKGVFVKRFEFEKEGEYTMADVDSIRTQLNAPGWSRIANVRSKREGNYDVVIMTEGSVIKGLAVLAAEAKAFTVVNIVGPIDVAKLSELEGKFGIPHFGLEQIPGVSVTEKKKDKNPEPDKQQEQQSVVETAKRTEKKPPTLIRPDKPPME